jgi:polar amino acid transport system substrate-binding protein
MKLVAKPSLYLLLFLSFSSAITADDVVMAFSQNIPPYILQQYNKGIEIDIIAAALAQKGHKLKPLYFPLGRVPLAFVSKLTDAVMGDMGIDLIPHGGFYADPAVIYDNVFITLKRKHISIRDPVDLDKYRIISFQGAEKRYPLWLSKAEKDGRFFGITDQRTQVEMLYLERYDVVLSDRYIFKYFVKQLKLINGIRSISVDEHQFVNVNPLDYRPVFRDEKVRDDFNFGLETIKQTGEFQEIYDNYLN